MEDFFANFFELFGTTVCAATDDLYDMVYSTAGLMWIFMTLFWVLLYYQGFFIYRQKAKWDSRVSWLIWMFVSSFLTVGAIWVLAHSQLNVQEGLDYAFAEYAPFLGVSLLWCIVLYFLNSLLFKFTNVGRRKIPF